MGDSFSYCNNRKQNLLASDIKRYVGNGNFSSGIERYFNKKLYEKIDFTEEDIKEALIASFIRTYYVNRAGHPTINDARLSIALYQSILNGGFETIDSLADTDNVRNFLIRNYIGNFDNYKIDNKTYDITNLLLKEFNSYTEKKKKRIKEKKLVKQKESE